jgi:hypothetical protein
MEILKFQDLEVDGGDVDINFYIGYEVASINKDEALQLKKYIDAWLEQ